VVGETFPVVVMTIGAGMVPTMPLRHRGRDIVVVDDVIVTVPGVDTEIVLRTVEDIGKALE